MRPDGPDILKAPPVVNREKFFSNANVAGPDDCWPWLRDGASPKYPRYRVGTDLIHVQQAAWQIENAEPTDEYRIVSTCGSALCVNPRHLALVERTVPEGVIACPAVPDSVYMGRDGVVLWSHGSHPGEVGEEGLNEGGMDKYKPSSMRLRALGRPALGVADDVAGAIRQKHRGGALFADIQREFGVSSGQINAVIRQAG